jgi:hypothetical protein
MLNQLNEWVSSLNTNMFFAGIMMLTLNIGSRYIQLNLSPSAESYLKYAITKEFLIFTIAWMGTRSIYVALTLTAAFIILSDYVFNDKSKFCMLPEKFKKLQSSIDLNDDKIISELEIKSAMEVLEKAKKQRENRVQLSYLSFYDNTKM